MMKMQFTAILFACLLIGCNTGESTKTETSPTENERFDPTKDLLLAHYDCKTDVDDLHSIAALATLIRSEKYSDIQYHAVAGAYGNQEGLYVPPNPLFELAFGNNWTDAHADYKAAVQTVKALAVDAMDKGGHIWIAEAGQSNFSTSLLKTLMYRYLGQDLTKNVHIVQHSEWNESVTDSVSLAYVKQFADYNKIPDGNALNNGTLGFKDGDLTTWKSMVTNEDISKIWNLADEISQSYNGVDGRYLNDAIKSGGLDFSDFSEVCWILEIDNLNNAKDFLEQYGGE